MTAKNPSVSRGGETQQPNRMSLFYFMLACILIVVPFAVYWFFIMEPMQKMMGE